MSSKISTVDQYKLDATFLDGTVIHSTRLVGAECITSPTTTWTREKKLGAGGFGVVWLECEQGSAQLRAVKVVSKLQLNLREVEAMVKLRDHPTLFVIFLGWFEDPHTVYLAMEYIEHGDLAQYIKTHGAKVGSQAEEITSQVLRALVVLHSREICHRDLKPGNILIVSPSPIWVKITDFGISKQSLGTSLRTGCGTPAYQAPELLGLLPNHMRLGRSGSYTKVVDLWALGAIVHEMLTSEIPFRDTYEGADWLTTEDAGMTSSTPAKDHNLPATVDTALLYGYCCGSQFPTDVLAKHGASADSIDLIKRLMAVDPQYRISATDALVCQWLVRPRHELKRQLLLLGSDVTLDDATRLSEASQAEITEILYSPGMSEIRAMMWEAVSMGYTEVVRVLLKVTDDINACFKPWNMSLLMIAARNGQVPMMKLLLQHGANINASVKPLCRTALHEAAAGGHLNALKVLLENGADANLQQDQQRGESALIAAAAGGHVEAMKLLLETDPKITPYRVQIVGAGALYAAAAGGHLDAIKHLLDLGVDVDAAVGNKNSQTPLYAAVASGHLDVITLLSDFGADINGWAPNPDGQTPLYGAAAKGNMDAMLLLLARGANLGDAAGTLNGQTALYAAASGGHLAVIRLLLDAGVDVHTWSPNPNGQTALHGAAGNGHLQAISLLLARGANLGDAAGTVNGQTALYAAAEGGHLDAIAHLLDAGVDVNAWAQTPNGQVPLHGAAAKRESNAILLLLARGANVNHAAGTLNGQTALYAAAASGCLHTLNLLRNAGANVNAWAPTPNGQIPLHGAAANGHLGIMFALLFHGAKVTEPALTGVETPLHAAAVRGGLDEIKLLLDFGATVEPSTLVGVYDPVIIEFLNSQRQSVVGWVTKYSARAVSAGEQFPWFLGRHLGVSFAEITSGIALRNSWF